MGGVASEAAKAGVPVIVLAGGILDFDYGQDITACFPIGRYPLPLEEALPQSEEFLYHTAYNAVRLFSAAGQAKRG